MSPEHLNDADAWAEAVAAHVLARDPSLDPGELRKIADSLAKYPDWRALPPADAASRVFDPPPSGASP